MTPIAKFKRSIFVENMSYLHINKSLSLWERVG
jgi:hypothetical protein